ncbi:hypothetical protein ILUMI_21678 [Ignelater luminosus]|uniref:Uncharacterized protein n=1 Tax=Ignelater luminosus TaxID=2038154 RepID=A0A8K0G3H9_IGNLU|nr:hypothetical protein ILUMI_21678 [Ignelater luminosus]
MESVGLPAKKIYFLVDVFQSGLGWIFFGKADPGRLMVVVATEYATRWAETKALADGTVKHVAKFVFEQAPSNYGLGHCVSQDFKMAKGVAAEVFKRDLEHLSTK